MKTLDLVKKLENKAIFTVQDIERITSSDREYASLVLHRLKKRNVVRQVTKNRYTVQDDIYVIASNLISPSYISFWSASSFLGYTDQILNTVFVATTVKKKSFSFEGYNIEFVPIKHFFGYRKIKTNEGEIFISETEKLLIDCFLKPEKCGNFDEIKAIFTNAQISERKLIEYLKKVNSSTIIQRVGGLLERLRNIDISKEVTISRNYITLNPFLNEWNEIDKKWRLRL